MADILDLGGIYAPAGLKERPPLNRLVLNQEVYTRGRRDHDPSTLYIMGERKLFGTLFNTIEVYSVLDKSDGSLIPFFIEKHQIKEVQDLIDRNRPSNVTVL